MSTGYYCDVCDISFVHPSKYKRHTVSLVHIRRAAIMNDCTITTESEDECCNSSIAVVSEPNEVHDMLCTDNSDNDDKCDEGDSEIYMPRYDHDQYLCEVNNMELLMINFHFNRHNIVIYFIKMRNVKVLCQVHLRSHLH